MSLFAETFSDTFEFWRKYFVSLLIYQLFYLIFYAIGGGIIFIGIFLGLFSLFGFGFTSSLIIILGPLIVGIIIFIIFGLAQGGGYPLMIKRADEGKKIDIMDVFTKSIKKVHKIFAVSILQLLPMLIVLAIAIVGIFVIIGSLFFSSILKSIPNGLSTVGQAILPGPIITGMATAPGSSPLSTPMVPDYSSIVGVVIILMVFILIMIPIWLVGYYFSMRLWLSVPILMIEDLDVVESLKKSWVMTKGKFWSISITIILVSIITGIISGVISLPLSLLGLSFIGSLINYLILAPISAVLASIYYYNTKREK